MAGMFAERHSKWTRKWVVGGGWSMVVVGGGWQGEMTMTTLWNWPVREER